MPDCTCDVRPPRHEFAHCREMIGKYAIRLDQWDDDTVFDPACPFHGDDGTMVARVVASSPKEPT
jgi:hypothetical protein